MKDGLIRDRNELYGPYVVNNLKKRNFDAYYVETKEEALEKAMEDVRKKMTDEKERKENLAIDIKADLERIQIIRSEI